MSYMTKIKMVGYSFLHNCVAHPLLFFTMDSRWVVQLHDWSGGKMVKKYKKLGVV